MQGRRIVVGITGGIAVYKTAELVRLLVKAGAHVQVAMTRNATRFVTPLTFEALSGHRVIWDMWDKEGTSIDHIGWAQESDLIIVAPATANFVAKMAHGLGDDFLSTVIIAATAPILVCPSMNSEMFRNPVVQDNLGRLRRRGIHVMAPGEGGLACRTEGPGRLPEPPAICEEAACLLAAKDLADLDILITAGPTIEPLDPVRFITNHSSGKMGYAVARAARRRGARVVLVSGPTNLPPPAGVTFCAVATAREMRAEVMHQAAHCQVIIKAAAVSDYRPQATADQKMKKGPDSLQLELVKNPDILAELGRAKSEFKYLLVGFAAETEDLVANASQKLTAKNLDMIVANDVSRTDAGFGTDTNAVKLITSGGEVEESVLMTKDEVADLILDRVRDLWLQRLEP